MPDDLTSARYNKELCHVRQRILEASYRGSGAIPIEALSGDRKIQNAVVQEISSHTLVRDIHACRVLTASGEWIDGYYVYMVAAAG